MPKLLGRKKRVEEEGRRGKDDRHFARRIQGYQQQWSILRRQRSVLLSLVDLFEVDSKESQQREKGKARRQNLDATLVAETVPEPQHSISDARPPTPRDT